jgi:stage III sporulation protein AG
MNFIRQLFKDKDKKTIINIAVALALGVVLLIVSGPLFSRDATTSGGSGGQTQAQAVSGTDADSDGDTEEYAENLESRLEDAFNQIDGVGKVKVLLTLSYGKELVVAEDKTSNQTASTESDAEGGSKTTQSSDVDEKTILVTDKDGVSAPLVLREVQPKIEGVVIIAEGGENVYVKEALTNAAQVVLGLSVDKIQVLKMK